MTDCPSVRDVAGVAFDGASSMPPTSTSRRGTTPRGRRSDLGRGRAAEIARTHPHWVEHARAYRAHFTDSLVGEVPGTADLVRELHAVGVPMWGLTNWSHEAVNRPSDR